MERGSKQIIFPSRPQETRLNNVLVFDSAAALSLVSSVNLFPGVEGEITLLIPGGHCLISSVRLCALEYATWPLPSHVMLLISFSKISITYHITHIGTIQDTWHRAIIFSSSFCFVVILFSLHRSTLLIHFLSHEESVRTINRLLSAPPLGNHESHALLV